ncbi:MAG: tRNA (guanosine(37)-N1)-methyltransferase TrmD, partial [Oscillospiraceae bacterium]|nr:tRNA (guanosine(37)-N1)-methyltransferase TrmD [Oscillospiraceae bacterium]
MQIDIMTLFPDMIRAVMDASIIGHAQGNGLVKINAVNIRDYSPSPNRRTDDYPYGGGQGLVMLAEPLYRCHAALCEAAGGKVHTILMSAQGQPYNQSTARRLLSLEHIILVCGHYEGIDERFIEECVDEEISLGDFVMTGGEIPAMAIADSICRMVPGVLSEEACFTDESHWEGLLEYPQYTRPEVWEGEAVPPVLLTGHHKNIAAWRQQQSEEITRQRRPDLWA